MLKADQESAPGRSRPKVPILAALLLLSGCLLLPCAGRPGTPAVPAPSASSAVEPERQAESRRPATAEIAPAVWQTADAPGGPIRLCQALGPAAPFNICGVDCAYGDWCRRGGWESARAIAWQAYAQGEYVGHARLPHVPEYRLRVDDEIDLIFRLTREETSTPYELNVGDEVRVESLTDPQLDRDSLIIQPDGTITVRLLGQVRATGLTVPQLRDELEGR
jgi:polysaccharide export outer membrane protein